MYHHDKVYFYDICKGWSEPNLYAYMADVAADMMKTQFKYYVHCRNLIRTDCKDGNTSTASFLKF